MAFLTEHEQDLITSAISEAEKLTSGEIRVAVEKHCKGEALDRATSYFARLGMDKTSLRHGVLIYLAYEDRKFAIIGDKGIHQVVPEDFWETVQQSMKTQFATGDIVKGLIIGIQLAGEKLSAHFPHRNGDINELPNDIIFMDQRDQTKK